MRIRAVVRLKYYSASQYGKNPLSDDDHHHRKRNVAHNEKIMTIQEVLLKSMKMGSLSHKRGLFGQSISFFSFIVRLWRNHISLDLSRFKEKWHPL